MKYYKDSIDRVYAYESDGSQDSWIPADLILITEEEADLLRQQSVIIPTPIEMWERIKTERDKRLLNGINVGGKWFHSDVYSITQHLGLKDNARDILAAGGGMSDPLIANGNPVMWKTLDGSFVALTVQTIFDVVEAGKNMQAAIFTAAEIHKAQMGATTEPWTYNYSVNWPLSYADSIL